MFTKLEKSRNYCEKLQNSLEKKIHECHILKKESKQNSVRKLQLEKKVVEQKVEILQYRDNADKKNAEILMSLNKENELVLFYVSLVLNVKKFVLQYFFCFIVKNNNKEVGRGSCRSQMYGF